MLSLLEVRLHILLFHLTCKYNEKVIQNASNIDNSSQNQRREILYPEYWQPFKEFVTSHGFSLTTKA